MSNPSTMNLKEAIAKGKLKEFIKERRKHKGDKSQFDATLSSMVRGKSKAVPKSSSQDDDGN